MRYGIDAVAFDCYGTLVDFGDDAFRDAYALICAEQGLTVDGQAFYDKWLEVWRRLARGGADERARGGAARHTPAPPPPGRPPPSPPPTPTSSAPSWRRTGSPCPW